MAEVKRTDAFGVDHSQYPSNSRVATQAKRETSEVAEDPNRPLEGVVIGKKIVNSRAIKRKKSVGKRLLEMVVGDQVTDVRTFVVQDILVPAVKDMVADMAHGITDILIYRDTRGGRGYRGYSHGYDYSRQYRSSDPLDRKYGYGYSERRRDPRNDGPRRALKITDDIIVGSKREAENVLSEMARCIQQYGQVTLSQVYSMVGWDQTYTDNYWGWYDMGSAHTKRVREGWLLDIPKPVPME